MPLARHKALAPAMFLPVVVLELLSLNFVSMHQNFYLKKKLSGSSGKLLYIYFIHIIPGSFTGYENKYEDNNMDNSFVHFL
jgi:hypothetical protein